MREREETGWERKETGWRDGEDAVSSYAKTHSWIVGQKRFLCLCSWTINLNKRASRFSLELDRLKLATLFRLCLLTLFVSLSLSPSHSLSLSPSASFAERISSFSYLKKVSCADSTNQQELTETVKRDGRVETRGETEDEKERERETGDERERNGGWERKRRKSTVQSSRNGTESE